VLCGEEWVAVGKSEAEFSFGSTEEEGINDTDS
jgi:hypothetical protein